MIQITPQMRILVAVEPADFRRGIDGLARVCKDVLQHDPFSGWVFVFRNRSATALKILVYDGQGFWLCHKRLSSGKFRWWPTGNGRARPRRWRPTRCKCFSRRAIPKPPKPRRPGGRLGRRIEASISPRDARSCDCARESRQSDLGVFSGTRAMVGPRETDIGIGDAHHRVSFVAFARRGRFRRAAVAGIIMPTKPTIIELDMDKLEDDPAACRGQGTSARKTTRRSAR